MTGSEICNRFFKSLIDLNKTKKDFCEETGVNQSALSNWSKRGTMPSAELIVTIADYLNCSTDYVLGRDYSPSTQFDITDSEADLIKTYRTLDDESKRMVAEMITFLKSKKQEN